MKKRDFDEEDLMRLLLGMLFEDMLEEELMAHDETALEEYLFDLADDEEVLFMSTDEVEGLFPHPDDESEDDRVEEPPEEKGPEMVNHPDHYNQSFLETMEKFLIMYADKPERIKGALEFNVIKYTDRAHHKGKKEEDEQKAKFYLDLFTELFPEEAKLYNQYRTWKGK